MQIHQTRRSRFEIGSSDTRTMISLLLRRQRHKRGLTIAEAARLLNARSRNACARCEQGASVPTIEKLDQLLRAIAPDREIVLRQSDAP